MFRSALRLCLCLSVTALLSAPAWGQPREWSDDFTTASTYDSDSLLAPCYGGNPTKYTTIEALVSDTFNSRAVSGDGRLSFTDRNPVIPPGLPGRVWATVIGWLGTGSGCPGEPPVNEISEPFTSAQLCMFGGYTFSPWQLDISTTSGFDIVGPDGRPGIANVDDDNDGATDEADESPAGRPTAVGGGYGSGDFGFPAGQDGQPGDAGVDDDGNGQTDEVGETGWPGTDDGDDISRHILWIMMRVDLGLSESVFIEADLGTETDLFNLRENRDLDSIVIESNDEIPPGFYDPYTHYNYAFCSSGTCYGAILWTEDDMANPNETLGPAINTLHNGPGANGSAFAFVHNTSGPAGHYLRRMKVMGNSNFSETFWVVSGDPTKYYPSPSADLDNDRDVDGFDFLTFSNCFNGSAKPPLSGCVTGLADLDGDEDVDGFDFLTFSNCFNGSAKRPLSGCFPPDLTACVP